MTDQDETIARLKSKIEEWKEREYDDGGPIDLEKAYVRFQRTAEEMTKILNGEDIDESSSDEEDLKPKKETKKAETKVEVDESTSISLDDIEDPLDKKETKKETKAESISDLDSELSLDSLDLDDLETPKSKIKVSATMLNEKRAEKDFVNKVVDFLAKSGKIKKSGDYVTDLKASYAILKGGDIEIEE